MSVAHTFRAPGDHRIFLQKYTKIIVGTIGIETSVELAVAFDCGEAITQTTTRHKIAVAGSLHFSIEYLIIDNDCIVPF